GGSHRRTSRRARGGGQGRRRRAPWPGRRRLPRPRRRRARRTGREGPLPAASCRLQDPEAGRLRGRAAEDRVRQGPARRIDSGDMMATLDPSVLDLDYAAEADRIAQRLRHVVARDLHRRGLVVAISGGIDSTTCAALAVRALGPERVFCLILPERDSSDDSAVRANLLARHLGVRVQTHDIAPTLAAIGCYQARDEAVRQVLPGYGEGW